MRARTLTRFLPEGRGSVALERPTWRVTTEPGDRRGIAATDVHEAKRGFPDAFKLDHSRTPRYNHVGFIDRENTKRSAVTLLPRGYHTPDPLNA